MRLAGRHGDPDDADRRAVGLGELAGVHARELRGQLDGTGAGAAAGLQGDRGAAAQADLDDLVGAERGRARQAVGPCGRRRRDPSRPPAPPRSRAVSTPSAGAMNAVRATPARPASDPARQSWRTAVAPTACGVRGASRPAMSTTGPPAAWRGGRSGDRDDGREQRDTTDPCEDHESRQRRQAAETGAQTRTVRRMELTRRRFIAAGAAAGAAIWLPDAVRDRRRRNSPEGPARRGGGVLDRRDVRRPGARRGDAVDAPGRRRAAPGPRAARDRPDPDFRHVVLRRVVPTPQLRDHTVKVRVGGLKPDRATGSASPRKTTTPRSGARRPRRRPTRGGRSGSATSPARTSPPATSAPTRRCSTLDPDVVICGGDYIYDRVYSDRLRRRPRGQDRRQRRLRGASRSPTTARSTGSTAPTPDLRELHRLVPLVAAVGRPRGHRQLRRHARPARPARRRRQRARHASTAPASSPAGSAWHEYMPARALRQGLSHLPQAALRPHASSCSCCDSRSYRDDQPCGGGTLRALRGRRAARVPRPASSSAGSRTASSAVRRTWKLIGNQLMIMPFEVAAGVKVEVDSWQGYHRPARRPARPRRAQRAIDDVVFLTGDIHTFFAGDRCCATARAAPPSRRSWSAARPPRPAPRRCSARRPVALPPELIEPLTDDGVPPGQPVDQLRRHAHPRLRAGRARARRGPRPLPRLAGRHDARGLARRPRSPTCASPAARRASRWVRSPSENARGSSGSCTEPGGRRSRRESGRIPRDRRPIRRRFTAATARRFFAWRALGVQPVDGAHEAVLDADRRLPVQDAAGLGVRVGALAQHVAHGERVDVVVARAAAGGALDRAGRGHRDRRRAA